MTTSSMDQQAQQASDQRFRGSEFGRASRRLAAPLPLTVFLDDAVIGQREARLFGAIKGDNITAAANVPRRVRSKLQDTFSRVASLTLSKLRTLALSDAFHLGAQQPADGRLVAP